MPLRGIGYQCHMASPLHGPRHHSLMPGACAGVPTRANLAVLRNKAPDKVDILIVYILDFIGTELTYSLTATVPAASASVIITIAQCPAPSSGDCPNADYPSFKSDS